MDKNDSLIFDEAEKLYTDGCYENALRSFKRIKEKNNDVINYIGCCEFKCENYNSAIEIFSGLITSEPNWSRPMYNLGQVFFKLQDEKKAFLLFERAAQVNEKDPDAYFYLGVYFEKMRNWVKAIECYKKSIALDTYEIEPHINITKCYCNVGDSESALNEAKIAYELDHDDSDVLFNLSFIMIKEKKYEDAFFLLNSSQTTNNHCDLLRNLMFCAKKLNRQDIYLSCSQHLEHFKE